MEYWIASAGRQYGNGDDGESYDVWVENINV